MKTSPCWMTLMLSTFTMAGCGLLEDATPLSDCDAGGCDVVLIEDDAPAEREAPADETPAMSSHDMTPSDVLYPRSTPTHADPAPADGEPCDGCELVIRGVYEVFGEEIWAPGTRIRLEPDARVIVRGSLTIQADVVLRFGARAGLRVEDGKLDVSGDAISPVRFESRSGVCGEWAGISAYGRRTSMRLRHAVVSGAVRPVESSQASVAFGRLDVDGACADGSAPGAGDMIGVSIQGGNVSIKDMSVRGVRGRDAQASSTPLDSGYGGSAYGVQIANARIDQFEGLVVEDIEGGEGFDTGVRGEGGGGWAVGISITNAPPMTELSRATVRGVRGGDGYGHGGESVGVWFERVERVLFQNVLVHGVTGGAGLAQGIVGEMVHGGFTHGIRGYGSSLELEHATIHGVTPGATPGQLPDVWDGMSAEIYIDGSQIGERTRVSYSALTGSPLVPAISLGQSAHMLLEYSLMHGVRLSPPTSGSILERDNVFADPGYSDEAAGNLNPGVNSALVDAGRARTVGVDVLGRTRDTTPDIGALELLR